MFHVRRFICNVFCFHYLRTSETNVYRAKNYIRQHEPRETIINSFPGQLPPREILISLSVCQVQLISTDQFGFSVFLPTDCNNGSSFGHQYYYSVP